MMQETEKKSFLPLGSVVILTGSVKKLFIVSRGSIVENKFYDYGALLYPEGMIDTNIAYFNHDDILKVVHEGYSDTDDQLILEILNDAYMRARTGEQADPATVRIGNVAMAASVSVTPPDTATAPIVDDPFASVRDLGDDDE